MKKQFGSQIVVLLFVLLFAVSVQADTTPAQLVQGAKAAIKEVDVHEAKKMLDSEEKIIFLDIRDPSEYEKEHIPGAIHMSRGLVDLHVNEILPDKNAKIVVY
jgi:3-mercaptopyruvate sulfurtransferase SseA